MLFTRLPRMGNSLSVSNRSRSASARAVAALLSAFLMVAATLVAASPAHGQDSPNPAEPQQPNAAAVDRGHITFNFDHRQQFVLSDGADQVLGGEVSDRAQRVTVAIWSKSRTEAPTRWWQNFTGCKSISGTCGSGKWVGKIKENRGNLAKANAGVRRWAIPLDLAAGEYTMITTSRTNKGRKIAARAIDFELVADRANAVPKPRLVIAARQRAGVITPVIVTTPAENVSSASVAVRDLETGRYVQGDGSLGPKVWIPLTAGKSPNIATVIHRGSVQVKPGTYRVQGRVGSGIFSRLQVTSPSSQVTVGRCADPAGCVDSNAKRLRIVQPGTYATTDARARFNLPRGVRVARVVVSIRDADGQWYNPATGAKSAAAVWSGVAFRYNEARSEVNLTLPTSPLKPGEYQVRVQARDDSNRAGRPTGVKVNVTRPAAGPTRPAANGAADAPPAQRAPAPAAAPAAAG